MMRIKTLLLSILLSFFTVNAMSNPLLSLNFDDGKLPPSALPGAKLVEGKAGQAILAASGPAGAFVLPASGNVNLKRGTIAFWLKPMESLYPLPRREETNLLVLDQGKNVDGNPAKTAAKVLNVFLAQPGSARLRCETFDDSGKYYGTLLEYRRLYADTWYHLVFTWDSTTGKVRQYLNAQLEQWYDLQPWTPQPLAGELILGNQYVAMDEIRIYDRALSDEEVADLAGLKPGEGLRDEGPQELEQTVNLESLRGEKILENGFNSTADISGWIMEGSGEALIQDGKLLLRANQKQNIVFWNPKTLPGDLLIEYDFTPNVEEGLCILFFCAAGGKGQDLFDPSLAKRDGAFPQYVGGDIVCYHVSYFRNRQSAKGVCNLRKDPGMPLIGVGMDPILPQAGGVYRISMYKKGDHFLFFIDGKLLIDTMDEKDLFGPPHGAGKIGLRHMFPMEACYDNLVVYKAR